MKQYYTVTMLYNISLCSLTFLLLTGWFYFIRQSKSSFQTNCQAHWLSASKIRNILEVLSGWFQSSLQNLQCKFWFMVNGLFYKNLFSSYFSCPSCFLFTPSSILACEQTDFCYDSLINPVSLFLLQEKAQLTYLLKLCSGNLSDFRLKILLDPPRSWAPGDLVQA